MKRLLATTLGRRAKGKRSAKKPRRSCRLALERLEAREVPVVGAFAIPPPVQPDTGFDGVVKLIMNSSPNAALCTGALLPSGRHILTAAHCLTNGNGNIDSTLTSVTFEMADGDITINVPAANYRVHPSWNGDVGDGDDLAVLELPVVAPSGPGRLGAERHEIFRGTNEVDQTFTVVGYGRTGTGESGAQAGTQGIKRKGLNVFGEVDDNKLRFTFGEFEAEGFAAPGDSGGPDLLDGQIAGVNSFVKENNLLGFNPEFEFGEHGFSTRVSVFADWIDAQTVTAGLPLVFDMRFQSLGNDGTRDRIDVQVTSGNLEISVNGLLHHSEPAAGVASLTIRGSGDSEDFRTIGPLGVDVTVDAGGSSGGPAQSLSVVGTSAADAVTVRPAAVSFGGRTISHAGLALTVATLGGSDVITLEGAGAISNLSVLGGADSDKLIGPKVSNLWRITRANGGTLNSLASFENVENLQGGGAADTFRFNIGASITGTVNGGAGPNTLDYSAFTSPIVVNLQLGTAPAVGGFSTITGVLGGGSASDTLVAPNQNNLWNITGSNAGNVGKPPIPGPFPISFGKFGFSRVENLIGGTAADTFKFGAAGSITGAVDGGVTQTDGPIIDKLDYSTRTTGVSVDLMSGRATGLGQVLNIEGVTGSKGADLLRGDTLANVLLGAGGFDVIVGEDGSDSISCGNTGRCVMIGGQGQDIITGGDQDDLLIGGFTDFDGDASALAAIMAEWRRIDRSYAERVQALRDGVPASREVPVQLSATTVHDDEVRDILFGNKGDDWFWAIAPDRADVSKLEFVN